MPKKQKDGRYRAKVIVPGMSAVFCCAIPAVSAPKHGACPLQCL